MVSFAHTMHHEATKDRRVFVPAGLEVVDAIAGVATNASDRPREDQKIASITVDTHGETYPEPKKLPDPYGRF